MRECVRACVRACEYVWVRTCVSFVWFPWPVARTPQALFVGSGMLISKVISCWSDDKHLAWEMRHLASDGPESETPSLYQA